MLFNYLTGLDEAIMNFLRRHLVQIGHIIGCATLVLAAAPSQAAVTFSDTPLFLTVTVPPNLILTLDDTGSMRRAFVPELCAGVGDNDCDLLDNRYAKAANYNLIHYNPDVKYPAPKTALG